MSKKNKKTEKPDLAPAEAIAALKEEILSNARKLATAQILTVYPLVEAAKELLILEGPQDKKDLEAEF